MNLKDYYKVLAFTGHRPGHVGVPGFDYSDSVDGYWNRAPGWQSMSNVLSDLFKGLLDESQGMPIKVIQGGALGTDMVAGLTAVRLKQQGFPIDMELAEPFKGQGSRWSPLAQRQLSALENVSDIVTDVSQLRYAPDMYTKYQNRNNYMLDNATDLIAFMNPAMATGRANGTEGTLNEALRRGMPTQNIFDLVLKGMK